MVWPHLKILWHGEDNSAGDSENSNERKTKEETGRYLQGMDRNGVWRFPERSVRQGKVATSSVVSRRPSRLRDLDERDGAQYAVFKSHAVL